MKARSSDSVATVVLHNQPGELVGIVGRSGSGKSTLLNILGLLDQPTGGTYVVRGINTVLSTRLKERRYGLGTLDSCFSSFTCSMTEVLGNVELGLLYRGLPSTNVASEHGGIGSCRHASPEGCMPATLSGGEKQRAAIARAISQSRKCCFATSQLEH